MAIVGLVLKDIIQFGYIKSPGERIIASAPQLMVVRQVLFGNQLGPAGNVRIQVEVRGLSVEEAVREAGSSVEKVARKAGSSVYQDLDRPSRT